MRFVSILFLALFAIAGCRCGEEPTEVIVMEPTVITNDPIAMAGGSEPVATLPTAACIEEPGAQCL